MSDNLLEGKVAIVTGAGRGIGRTIALSLAANGAKVVVNDLGGSVDGTGNSNGPSDDVVSEIVAHGGEAVSNYDTVDSMEGGENIVRQALAAFGQLDIIVLPAGILRDRMVFNMTEEEWDAVIAVHLKGHFSVIKPASIVFRQQRQGRIICFSSVSGLFGNSGQANYGAAKDGIAGLTRVVSRDLGRYGITVNCISPGASTRMTQTVPDSARQLRADRGIQGGGGSAKPQQRPPEAIAEVVTWLASDEAADVNGQIIHISGGLVGLMSHPSPVRTISKGSAGSWTVEELADAFPQTLGMDLVNPAPPAPPSS